MSSGTLRVHGLLDCPFCGGRPFVMVGMQAFTDIEIRCRKCNVVSPCFDAQTVAELEMQKAKTFGKTVKVNTGAYYLRENIKAAKTMWNHRTVVLDRSTDSLRRKATTDAST